MSSSASVPARTFDIVIAGGGYVGLSLAAAVKAGAPSLSVLLAEPRPISDALKDMRAYAIAPSARRMLDTLGLWQDIAGDAQPVLKMEITDSRLNDVYRPVFLNFDAEGDEDGALAHMVPQSTLIGTLYNAARDAGVEFLNPGKVTDFDVQPEGCSIKLSDGSTAHASLLVGADGKKSLIRRLSGITTTDWIYDQSGIVTTVEHERPHNGVAEEHFLPAGPFAILPLTGNRSSLVWTESRDYAEKLVRSDDMVFRIELERRFGHKLGEIRPVGPRHAFPLGLMVARSFVTDRIALIGDAAHAVHPIAGQGLNLGFKDVAALAETVIDTHRLGLDIGSIINLETYQTWRRFDTWRMAAVTDVLNRMFSNDLPPVRAARSFGLGLVERMPRLKDFFIGEAAEAGRSEPRLLRGEAL